MAYFARENGSLLRLTKTGLDGSVIRKACANGSFELMSNRSTSLVSILYNFQPMCLAEGLSAPSPF